MIGPTIRGLLIGAAGGLAFALLHVPAPWLAGSMAAAVVAIISGVRLNMPDWLKALAFIFLGIQTGTSVTWDTVDRAAQWPLSLALLAITVVAVVAACYFYFVRARGWDRETALFASLPGALSLVLALASETKADMRKVTIAQCIRLFFLIAALPAVILWLSPTEGAAPPAPVIGSLFEIALLISLSAAAGFGLERLRVPAGLIMGPVLVAATLELSGFIHGTAPDTVLIPANIILGVMIAARFNAFTFTEFRLALREGFTGFVIALAIAMVGAWIASALGGLPLALTLLAFSPGGLDAMTLMAFALDLDPAYVGAHQIARYVGMVLLMPVVTAWLLGRINGFGARPSRLEDE
jgi:uncharacterized protein